MEPSWPVTLAELDDDPHPVLARMRERAPACWVPELGGWLVTGYAAAVGVLTDPVTFTVDDPRFTTARVTGPSMLSADGAAHARHRAPFAHAFRPAEVQARLAGFAAAEAARLAAAIAPAGEAELREAVAGPLAAAVMAEALGLPGAGVTPAAALAWYRDIAAAVADLPAAAPGTAAAAGPAGRVPVHGAGGRAAPGDGRGERAAARRRGPRRRARRGRGHLQRGGRAVRGDRDR